MHVVYLVLAFIAGAVLPLQLAANSALGRAAGHPLLSSINNFVVGLVALLALTAALRVPMPESGKLTALPWWTWIGGLFGAGFVGMSVWLAPKLGAAQWTVAIIAGQLCAAVVMDHFGWMGFAVREFTPMRAVGVALVLGGVLLVRAG
jgi:transporter family-2 protein